MKQSDLEAGLAFQLRVHAKKAKKGPKGPKGRKQYPFKGHQITVVLSCRPADGMGFSVTIQVTTDTVSEFEADLKAFAEARKLGLKLPVVVTRLKD